MTTNSSDTAIYPPQPVGSVIRLHEATPQRLVLDIPPGKQSGGLGCFAILWNGFMAVFTAVAGGAQVQQQGFGNELFPWLFIGLFWLIGFGLIYAWLKMRYERCFLLIEPDRAVLRKMFLGRQRQTELALDETSRAQLTESYKQNDVPVYRVTVTGIDGKTLHFGTSLEQNEKDWCVDAVNTLLQPKPTSVSRTTVLSAAVCKVCGTEIPSDAFQTQDGLVICPGCEHEQTLSSALISSDVLVFDPLENVELPGELPGVVTILEDSPERLGLRLSVVEYAAVKWLIALFAAGFAAIWYYTCGGDMIRQVGKVFAAWPPAGVFGWMDLLFPIPFLLVGVVPLGMVCLAFWGRLTTWIDREFVKIRVHVGPFGKTWTMNTSDVTAVRLIDSSEMPSRQGNPRVAGMNSRVQGSQQYSKAAGICAARVLSMTALHEPLTTRFVVKIVKTWLRENMPDRQI